MNTQFKRLRHARMQRAGSSGGSCGRLAVVSAAAVVTLVSCSAAAAATASAPTARKELWQLMHARRAGATLSPIALWRRALLYSHTGGHSPGYALGRKRLRRRICLQRNAHLSKTKSVRRSVPRLVCVQCMTNGANHDSQCKTTKSCHSEFIQPGLHKNQTV